MLGRDDDVEHVAAAVVLHGTNKVVKGCFAFAGAGTAGRDERLVEGKPGGRVSHTSLCGGSYGRSPYLVAGQRAVVGEGRHPCDAVAVNDGLSYDCVGARLQATK
jgi:hypothetical protein